MTILLASTECSYPIVAAAGMCCGRGAAMCDLEWHRPCGSCWDFSTCGDCAVPVWPGLTSRYWAAPEFPKMLSDAPAYPI